MQTRDAEWEFFVRLAADKLRSMIERDPQVRMIVEAFARAVLAPHTENEQQPSADSAEPEVSIPAAQQDEPATEVHSVHAAEPDTTRDHLPVETAARMLKLGLETGLRPAASINTVAAKSMIPTTAAPVARVDLGLLARRCVLKADACRWCVSRGQNDRAGMPFDEVKPGYDNLRLRAEPIQPVYMWMIHRDMVNTPDDAWIMLEGCYRNLANAADIAASEGSDLSPESLSLIAEAQSALLAGLQAVGRVQDAEQAQAYAWCRSAANEGGHSVEYLSLGELANPSSWRGLASRLDAAAERQTSKKSDERGRRKALNKARYEANRLADADLSEHTKHWNSINEAARMWAESGGQPSSKEFIELIIPVLDLLPDDFTPSAELSKVLVYADRQLAAQEETGELETRAEREPAAELRRVRELLRGSVVVLIGGKCRPKSKALLEREMELKELNWISSDPHDSIAHFEHAIAREGTSVVLLAIRWSSHSYEGVQDFCRKYAKPFVRLPAGYGPNQVAYQIIRQQGEVLVSAHTG